MAREGRGVRPVTPPPVMRHVPYFIVAYLALALAGVVSAAVVAGRDESRAGTGDTASASTTPAGAAATSDPAAATSSTPATGAPPDATSPVAVEDLSTLLLDLTDQGYQLQPDEPPLTGPLTIHDQATFDGVEDPEALQELTTLGYQRGFVRRWVLPGQVVALDGVHECSTPEGVQGMLAADVEYYGEQSAEPFEIPGVPGAVGYSYDTNPDAPGELHNVEFTLGSRLFQVNVNGPGGSAALAVQLAQAQYALVGGG